MYVITLFVEHLIQPVLPNRTQRRSNMVLNAQRQLIVIAELKIFYSNAFCWRIVGRRLSKHWSRILKKHE